MMILLLALALVGVGAMTRAEAKAAKQLRKAVFNCCMRRI